MGGGDYRYTGAAAGLTFASQWGRGAGMSLDIVPVTKGLAQSVVADSTVTYTLLVL